MRGSDAQDQPQVVYPTATSVPIQGQLINGSARDTKAEIDRRYYRNYQERGIPLENELIESYRNPELWNAELNNSQQAVNSSFDTAAGTLGRNAARTGVNLNASQQEAQGRSLGLGKAAALVDAKNNTRTGLVDRDQAIMTGGMSARVDGVTK